MPLCGGNKTTQRKLVLLYVLTASTLQRVASSTTHGLSIGSELKLDTNNFIEVMELVERRRC